ncbi:MAG: hypothetical protein AAGF95_06245 [Chloroflexota bacterium]
MPEADDFKVTIFPTSEEGEVPILMTMLGKTKIGYSDPDERVSRQGRAVGARAILVDHMPTGAKAQKIKYDTFRFNGYIHDRACMSPREFGDSGALKNLVPV